MAVVSLGADIFTRHIGRAFGRDFTNAWIGGRLALEGRPWCAFDENCFRLAMYQKLDVLNLQNFSYPPHTLFLDAPFAIAPYYAALAIWTITGAAFFYWAAKPALPEGFRPTWALLTPAALLNVWNGHYGFILGGLWLLCFRNLDRSPAKSGLTAGLLTFKPHMGLMIAVTMLTNWRAVAVAAVTTAALVVASALVFGPGTWLQFITATTATQTDVLTRTTEDFYFRMMPSAYVAYGHGPPAIAAQILFAIAAVLLLAKSRTVNVFTFATATFLIVPYVFNYDMVVVCLGIAILLWTRWTELSFPERAALSAGFISPEVTYFAPELVPPALLASLWVQTIYCDNFQRPKRAATRSRCIPRG